MDNNEFANEDLGCRFTIKRPTVAQQLIYLDNIGRGTLVAWFASRPMIETWESEYMPDKEADLTQVTDGMVTQTVTWAADCVASYMNDLGAIPKNKSRR